MTKSEIKYTNYKEFLQNLKIFFKKQREKKVLTIIEMAKELEAHQSVVASYETGDAGLTLRMLLKWMDFFGYQIMFIQKGKKYVEVNSPVHAEKDR